MRDHILLYLNGRRCQVSDREAFVSLSDFLRRKLGLVGTKIVCSEGDCGACSVLIGRPIDGQMQYRSVDACIQFMFQLDGSHVVSVEGLGRNGTLSPVQQSMVDCHGSQCGFCTPGFVVAMTGMLEEQAKLDEADLRYGLTGNLCRCTGYTPILDAGIGVDGDAHLRVEQLYPSGAMLEDFRLHAPDEIQIRSDWDEQEHLLSAPTDVLSAASVLESHPDATVVAGATDVGVQINKSQTVPSTILDLNRVADMQEIRLDQAELVLGARASWTEIERACEDLVPEFYEILTLFGSPQIRNVGTIGGNIINASPIADSLPFLCVTEAQLELRSTAGSRLVNINDFYLGYKELNLEPGELLWRVRIPLPKEEEVLRLYKVSRRRDLDISGFTAAIRMRLDGETIDEAAIALGAVGPTVIRARQTEAFLKGAPLSEDTMHQAGEIAVQEVRPITDVRGSADYRLQLTRNILLKFYHQTMSTTVPV